MGHTIRGQSAFRTLLLPILPMIVGMAVSACDDSNPMDAGLQPSAAELTLVSGQEQSGRVGTELADPFVVRVVDSKGRAVSRSVVNFRVTEGGGKMRTAVAMTDKDGLARDWLTLGSASGANRVEARAAFSSNGQRTVYGTFTAHGVAASSERTTNAGAGSNLNPGAPTLDVRALGKDSVEIRASWKSVTGARSYKWMSATETYRWQRSGSASGTSVTVRAPRENVTYGFCVEAVGVTGAPALADSCTPFTAPASAATPAPAPSPVPAPAPAPVAPPTSGGSSNGVAAPFFSDSFDNGRKTNANGFQWSGGPAVSTERARSGSHSLRFRFAAAGGHDWAEQRFSLGRNVTELWVEYWIWYPSNYTHRNASPSNNKFFRLWGGDYGAVNKVGASTWAGTGGASRFRFDYTKASGSGIGPGSSPTAAWGESSMLGRWSQVRMYYKHATRAQNDGVMRIWKDGQLVADFRNVDQKYTSQPYWNAGYILGYDNSGFQQETIIYVDDVKFWAENPGW